MEAASRPDGKRQQKLPTAWQSSLGGGRASRSPVRRGQAASIREKEGTKSGESQNANERSIVIHNSSLNDTGLYKAFITDESSDPPSSLVTTNSCHVIVKKLQVEFITPLENLVKAKTNDTVKLYCETVQENLKPKWFFKVFGSAGFRSRSALEAILGAILARFGPLDPKMGPRIDAKCILSHLGAILRLRWGSLEPS